MLAKETHVMLVYTHTYNRMGLVEQVLADRSFAIDAAVANLGEAETLLYKYQPDILFSIAGRQPI